MVSIAEADVDLLYVLTGRRDRSLPRYGQDRVNAWIKGLIFPAAPSATDTTASIALDGADFASIPLHEAALAAGMGADNDSESIIGHLAFRRDWLTRIGVSASNAVLARAQGDSMNPCIHDGDLMLIDRSKTDAPVRGRATTDRRPSPIYALLQDGQARVKRIERPEPGLIMLMSDNPAYGPEVLTGSKIAALNIIGKVMWWGHTNRE
ncbi:MAG: S24 family peptidase [Gemmobacter sp.]|nr:S24 family peptidase [Gemmobacter sp.]